MVPLPPVVMATSVMFNFLRCLDRRVEVGLCGLRGFVLDYEKALWP